MTKIEINTEYITLGQFLKLANVVSTGGMVKPALLEYKISVNDLQENRRGKKLYPGDKVSIKTIGDFRIVSKWKLRNWN